MSRHRLAVTLGAALVSFAAIGAAATGAVAAPAPVATTTSVTASPSSLHPFETLTATATVRAAAGATVPTGTVTFTRGTQTLCNAVPVTPQGSASCVTHRGDLTLGNAGVAAAYSPGSVAVFGASSGTSAAVAFAKWTPTITTVLGPDATCPGQLKLTITVKAPSAAATALGQGLPQPSGTVTAQIAAKTLTLPSSGTVSTCVPVEETEFVSYSGASYYNRVSSKSVTATSTQPIGTAPRGGTAVPSIVAVGGAAPSAPGGADGGLANTGTSTPTTPLLWLGALLVLLGAGLLRVTRRSH